MKHLLALTGLLLLLAGCGGEAGPGERSVIQWDRSPQTIVFRADVVGGDSVGSFRARNEVPLCTIYGDNRIVWVNELADFETQVLWDRLTDQQIQDFVAWLTIVQRIYTYDAQADLQPPTNPGPVVETLSLFVNERQHKTDSFSSWELDYFKTILDVCKTTSIAPVLFEPQGAWASAQVVPYNPNLPALLWDGDAAGLKMADLAASSEARWLTGPNLRILWNSLRTASPLLVFQEGESSYLLALEVPGVTRDAPPAP